MRAHTPAGIGSLRHASSLPTSATATIGCRMRRFHRTRRRVHDKTGASPFSRFVIANPQETFPLPNPCLRYRSRYHTPVETSLLSISPTFYRTSPRPG